MLADPCLALRRPRALRSGFSMVEIIIALTLLGLVGAVIVDKVISTRTAAKSTKLVSDVKRLNSIVAVYLAEGGSLANVTTVQGVLDKLKTVRPSSEIQRNVGMMTGRGVDKRLVARTQTAKEASSTDPRVVWNSTSNQFEIKTSGNGAVAEFKFDDSLATAAPATDTRSRSNVLYNGDPGWVWAPGTNAENAFLSPINVAMANTAVTPLLDPTTSPTSSSSSGGITTTTATGTVTTSSSSSTSSSSNGSNPSGTLPNGSTPGKLPTPVITTKGGRFSADNFPTQEFIDPNASPGAYSVLKYQLNNTGSWITYTGPLSVPSGTTITAKNVSTNTTLYTDSSTDTESYYIIQSWFAGTVAAKWNSSTGPSGFTSSRNNTNPLSVTETDGRAASSSTNGANTFNFTTPGSFTNIQPNTSFTIGQLVYHNGTINSGTGSTGLNLQLDITMSTPAIATTSAHISISLSNTVNSGDGSNSQSADAATLANPVTDYSVVVNGVTYTLVVSYGSIDSSQGYVSGNTVNVWEGATGTVSVVAQFVSNH